MTCGVIFGRGEEVFVIFLVGLVSLKACVHHVVSHLALFQERSSVGGSREFFFNSKLLFF